MTTYYPKILAIDFGTQRIGVAVSRGSLAEPLMIIPNSVESLEMLKEICQEEAIEQIVVGESEGAMAEKSRAFGEMLVQRLGLPVHYVDETLSSKTVEARLRSLKRSRPNQPIDHFAAAVILEEWLDN